MPGSPKMESLPPDSETGAFINFFPEELPSSVLKGQVRSWMEEREYAIREEDDHLVFQMGHSFVAGFFYHMPLSSGLVRCLSLQAYALGRYGAQFLDDKDLAAINEKLHVGRLVRGHKRLVLLTYNVLAEGMKKASFFTTLDVFKNGIDATDQQIQILLSTT